MKQAGKRTISGKIYTLGSRTSGLNAKAVAQAEAAAKRANGHLTRIVKVSNIDYLVYQI